MMEAYDGGPAGGGLAGSERAVVSAVVAEGLHGADVFGGGFSDVAVALSAGLALGDSWAASSSLGSDGGVDELVSLEVEFADDSFGEGCGGDVLSELATALRMEYLLASQDCLRQGAIAGEMSPDNVKPALGSNSAFFHFANFVIPILQELDDFLVDEVLVPGGAVRALSKCATNVL